MPLILKPATEADVERAVKIEHDAYQPKPSNKVLFPGPFPPAPEGTDPRVEWLLKALHTDPSTRWLKVVDTDIEDRGYNEQMIGFAQWNINDGSQIPPLPRTFGEGCNVEACEALFDGLKNARAKACGDKKHVHLSLLQVDPAHQRRGAGKMMVMWGIEEAKKLGFPAYLESSEEGHSLYLQCGFRDIGEQRIDLSKWGFDMELVNYIMCLDVQE